MFEKINCIGDGLGYPIDEGIKHVVVSFNLCGLKTSASCEGHLNWGLPYPWIDLDPLSRQKFDSIITEYNKDKRDYLYLRSVDKGIFGAGRVMNYNRIQDNGINDERFLTIFQKEINEFADFLIKEL